MTLERIHKNRAHLYVYVHHQCGFACLFVYVSFIYYFCHANCCAAYTVELLLVCFLLLLRLFGYISIVVGVAVFTSAVSVVCVVLFQCYCWCVLLYASILLYTADSDTLNSFLFLCSIYIYYFFLSYTFRIFVRFYFNRLFLHVRLNQNKFKFSKLHSVV